MKLQPPASSAEAQSNLSSYVLVVISSEYWQQLLFEVHLLLWMRLQWDVD